MCKPWPQTITLGVLFLAALSATPVDQNGDISIPVVKVKQGLLAGTNETWTNGKTVYKFLYVPYALPPVGERRFQDPVPMSSWPGTWDASEERKELVQCLQYRQTPRGSKVMGQEDCLYLSIFTPRLPIPGEDTKLLNVIVYIHGGAFMFGSQHIYNPISLLSGHDVVFVRLNYRLGPLGFLSTGDDIVGGNMGMKDQIEALRWIQDNIVHFGGNPNSVTITGTSAGGASTHFHMLSPLSRGLFHKAISMSGTMLCPWTVAENLPEKTRLIARHVSCPVDDNKLMVECLRSRPATYLVDAAKLTQPFRYNPFSPWGPTIDGYARNPALPLHPVRLIKKGKMADVPWINSVNSMEGLYPGAEFLGQDQIMSTINSNWTILAPHILDFNFTVDPQIKEEVAAKIRYEYLKDKPIILDNIKPFLQMLGDRLFIVDAERTSRFMAEVNKAPAYFYMFNFRGRYSLSNIFSQQTKNYGVSHADDTMYAVQFNPDLLINTTAEEQEAMDFMTNLWTAFAEKGKPHISSWIPVRPDAFNYLRIDSGSKQIMLENVKEIGLRSFWDSLPIKEYNVWHESNNSRINYIDDTPLSSNEKASMFKKKVAKEIGKYI